KTKRCLGTDLSWKIDGIKGKIIRTVSRLVHPLSVDTENVKITFNIKGKTCLCCEEAEAWLSGGGSVGINVLVPVVAGTNIPSRKFNLSIPGYEDIDASLSAFAGF